MEKELEKDDDYLPSAIIESKENDFILIWDEASGLSSDAKDEYAIENIILLLEKFLESNGGRSIKVTPEGPFLEGSQYDAASVAWAINAIYGDEPTIKGDLPTMKDLGLDESSNFDKNGNPLVR
jgi:hypothetical protein